MSNPNSNLPLVPIINKMLREELNKKPYASFLHWPMANSRDLPGNDTEKFELLKCCGNWPEMYISRDRIRIYCNKCKATVGWSFPSLGGHTPDPLFIRLDEILLSWNEALADRKRQGPYKPIRYQTPEEIVENEKEKHREGLKKSQPS